MKTTQSIVLAISITLFSSLTPANTRGLHRNILTATTETGSIINLYEQSHALLIGVSKYTKGWDNLEAIPAELDNVQQALEEKGFNVIRVDNPTQKQMKSAFEDFISDYGYDANNRLLFYYSGHGHSDKNRGYLVPSDAPLPDEDPKGFRRHSLDMSQVLAWARNIDAKHALFMFDSCFSGSIFKAKNTPSRKERYIRNATSQPVRQFISAGSAGETVPAKSTFTPVFVEDIREGAGDLNNDGYITGSELGLYLSQTVPQYVNQSPQYGKIRDFSLAKGDFVFFNTNKKPIKKPVITTQTGNEAELTYWKSVESNGSKQAYQIYINKYPNGMFLDIAKLQISSQKPLKIDNNRTDPITINKIDPITDNVQDELLICKDHINNNRLTTGKKGNALACYKQILSTHPNNQQANNGINNISNKYILWIESSINKNNINKARRLLNGLALASPNSDELNRLRKLLKKRSATTKPSSSVINKLLDSNKANSTNGHYHK